jgi:hypothetical protein
LPLPFFLSPKIYKVIIAAPFGITIPVYLSDGWRKGQLTPDIRYELIIALGSIIITNRSIRFVSNRLLGRVKNNEMSAGQFPHLPFPYG